MGEEFPNDNYKPFPEKLLLLSNFDFLVAIDFINQLVYS